jgi:hypothetical protein
MGLRSLNPEESMKEKKKRKIISLILLQEISNLRS